VQLSSNVTKPLDQHGLDMHVNIFAFRGKRELARLKLGLDIRQAPHNLVALVGSDQTYMT
jgi:hypothetical protein